MSLFVLTSPIHLSHTDVIPVGATGNITRYDADHIQLNFDADHKALSYWGGTLILDEHDTDDAVWKAIRATSKQERVAQRVGVGLGSLALSIPMSYGFARLGMSPGLGFFAGVALVAYLFGRNAALVATGISVITFNLIDVPPLYEFAARGVREWSLLLVCLTTALLAEPLGRRVPYFDDGVEPCTVLRV